MKYSLRSSVSPTKLGPNKGYVDLIYEAFAQDEVCMREVCEGLQENHGCNVDLEGARVQLVPNNR